MKRRNSAITEDFHSDEASTAITSCGAVRKLRKSRIIEALLNQGHLFNNEANISTPSNRHIFCNGT